jgi:hypothetical protein
MSRRIWVVYTFFVTTLALYVAHKKNCKKASLEAGGQVISIFERTEGRKSGSLTTLNRVLVGLHAVCVTEKGT